MIDRVSRPGARVACAKPAVRNKLMEHRGFVACCGDDRPEITGWRWKEEVAASASERSTKVDNIRAPDRGTDE